MSTPQPKTLKPLRNWFLQAFDLRAGLAFATFREEQHEGQEIRDWPCLFIGAPDFSPEPVDNVGAALAATRGSFDSSLLDGEREVSFLSIEDVAEFVRRAYVSSAGGDGSDGPEGQTEPPPLPPDFPERPRTLDKVVGDERPENSANAALHSAVRAFAEHVRAAEPGSSFESSWTGIESSDAVDSIARGTLHVVRELLTRIPVSGDDDLPRWLDDTRTFGGRMTALGIWPFLLVSQHHEELAKLGQFIRRKLLWHWEPPSDDVEFVPLLFATAIDPFDDGALSLYWSRRFPYELLAARSAGSDWIDPFEQLRHVPLPGFAAPMLPTDAQPVASLQHLLTTFVASPQASLEKIQPADRNATIDLVILAATWVASLRQTSSSQELSGWSPWHVTPLRRQALRNAGNDGLSWLMEHLPKRGFPAAVEQQIFEARAIRYSSAATADVESLSESNGHVSRSPTRRRKGI